MTLRPAGQDLIEVFSRHFIESLTGLAIYMLDPDGYVASWSAGAQQVKGYAAEEVIGQHFSVFFPDEERKAGRPDMLLQNARTGGRITWDGWRVRKDGSRFWAAVVSDPMRNQNGNLIGFATVTRDVSIQRQMSERFRQMIEAAPTAMVMIQPSGRIEMVNTLVERMFGYGRAKMLGQPVDMLIAPPCRDLCHTFLETFLTVPQSYPMVLRHDLGGLRQDGSAFAVEIGLNRMEIDGNVMAVATIVDISDRRKLEKYRLDLYKSRTTMLGEIHHRVKNNLHVVYTLLDMQSSRIRDNEALLVLRESQNRVRSMALIHQILYESG